MLAPKEPVTQTKPQYDWVMLFIKVGDKQTAPGKEHLGLKDGMPVCHLDPNDPKQLESIDQLSDNMKTVYAAMKWPSARLPELTDALQPNQAEGLIDPATYRARKKLFTLEDIEGAVGIPGLASAWRGKGKVEPIDGMKLSATLFKNSDTLNAPAKDLNLITTGSATYGTAGDYATKSLAYADAGNQTGDLTFTAISDITETAKSVLNWNVGAFAFVDSADTYHNGLFLSGRTITRNMNDYGIDISAAAGTGTIEIKNTVYTQTNIIAFAGAIILLRNNITFSGTISIHNNLFNGINDKGIFVSIEDATPKVTIYNNAIENLLDVGLSAAAMNANNRIENNTIKNCGTGIDAGLLGGTYQNNVCISNTADYSNTGGATGNNNASSDATAADANWSSGSNNVTNITPANSFVSFWDTSIYFLKPDHTDTDLIGAGIAPSITANTTDIRGNARPGAGGYCIGAANYDGIQAFSANFGEQTDSDYKGDHKCVYVRQDTPAVSNATTADVGTRGPVGAAKTIGLERWSLNGHIPIGASIQSAMLTHILTIPRTTTVSIHDMLTDWGVSKTNEGVTQAIATGGQATYRRAFDFNGAGGDVTWSAGDISSADYGAAESTYSILATDTIGTKFSASVITMVKAWLLDDSQNFGNALTGSLSTAFQWFGSDDHGTVANRPYLVVDWVIPQAGWGYRKYW